MADIAVFPGSFDPLTLGHHDIVLRGAQLFEKVYVAVGNNTTKKYMLPFEARQLIVRQVFEPEAKVEVVGYDELTVNLCQRLGARYLLRGLRSAIDYEFERNIAFMNQQLNENIETVFLMSRPEFSRVSSTIVREIHKYGGDIGSFVPEEVVELLKNQ